MDSDTISESCVIIKMNILPRLLYLLHNLPIEVSGKDFKEWDKIISRFLWQGAKPRIRYKTLQLSKERGGSCSSMFEKIFLCCAVEGPVKSL